MCVCVCWRGLSIPVGVVAMVLIDPVYVHCDVYINMPSLMSVSVPFQLSAYSYLCICVPAFMQRVALYAVAYLYISYPA